MKRIHGGWIYKVAGEDRFRVELTKRPSGSKMKKPLIFTARDVGTILRVVDRYYGRSIQLEDALNPELGWRILL